MISTAEVTENLKKARKKNTFQRMVMKRFGLHRLVNAYSSSKIFTE